MMRLTLGVRVDEPESPPHARWCAVHQVHFRVARCPFCGGVEPPDEGRLARLRRRRGTGEPEEETA